MTDPLSFREKLRSAMLRQAEGNGLLRDVSQFLVDIDTRLRTLDAWIQETALLRDRVLRLELRAETLERLLAAERDRADYFQRSIDDALSKRTQKWIERPPSAKSVASNPVQSIARPISTSVGFLDTKSKSAPSTQTSSEIPMVTVTPEPPFALSAPESPPKPVRARKRSSRRPR